MEQFTGSQAEREKVLTFFFYLLFFLLQVPHLANSLDLMYNRLLFKKGINVRYTFRASEILINKFNNDFQRDKEKLNP